MFLQHNGPSTTYFQNYTLLDAEGNVAYKFTLRHGDAGVQYNDGSDNTQHVIAPKNDWFKFKLEYTYIDAETVSVKVYVNDELKYESSKFVGETAIKDIAAFRHTTDVGVAASIFYDDFSFTQIKK